MCFYVLCIQIILLYVQIYLFNDSADWWIFLIGVASLFPPHQFLYPTNKFLHCNFLDKGRYDCARDNRTSFILPRSMQNRAQ